REAGAGRPDHGADDRVPAPACCRAPCGAPRDPPRPRRVGRREPPAPPAADRPDAAHATPPAPAPPRQAVLARQPGASTRPAPPPGPGHARHRRALAPLGLAAPLAV